MKLLQQSIALCAFIAAMGFMSLALAEDMPKTDAAKAASEMAAPAADTQVAPKVEAKKAPEVEDEDVPKDLVLKGDAQCTSCHDESDAPELLAIGKTMHGTVADIRTPTCTACHGASERHVHKPKNTTVRPKPDHLFSGKRIDAVEDRNGVCMECHHKDANRSHWEGSTHQSRDIACTSCHKIHTAKDMVRDKLTQAEVCFSCHKEQRSQVNKPSHHPIMEGKMACSDCHNVHGSAGPKLMKRDSVVDTCYTCHMEKRGPFVHEHEPVGEDCTICHNPHGTTAESMLKMRPPFLCQSCHTPHGAVQPSLAGQTAPPGIVGWWDGSAITQGRGCMNCHTQIHGSNNPGLANPAPQSLFR
jgi:DmsE family decaheme c-type cytochrome